MKSSCICLNFNSGKFGNLNGLRVGEVLHELKWAKCKSYLPKLVILNEAYRKSFMLER